MYKRQAKNIVAYREENGRFESRRELLKVAKLGTKAFEPVSYTHLDVYKRQPATGAECFIVCTAAG